MTREYISPTTYVNETGEREFVVFDVFNNETVSLVSTPPDRQFMIGHPRPICFHETSDREFMTGNALVVEQFVVTPPVLITAYPSALLIPGF